MDNDILMEAAEIVNGAYHRGQAGDLAAELEAMPAQERAEVLTQAVPEVLALRLARLGAGAQVRLLTRVLWAIVHG